MKLFQGEKSGWMWSGSGRGESGWPQTDPQPHCIIKNASIIYKELKGYTTPKCYALCQAE